MKKSSILILAGVIPFFFIFYIIDVMKTDNRNEAFEKAIPLTQQSFTGLQAGDFVRITGTVSPSNSPRFQSFILATREAKVKQRDRSVWLTEESFLGDINLQTTDFSGDILVKISPEYIPCGNSVKIEKENKDSKSRILGISIGDPFTGYGKILSLNPLQLDLGMSPCAESLENYSKSLSKKFPAYVMAVLFLAIPSFFLIYLGIYSRKDD
jgi:hypothetical protein